MGRLRESWLNGVNELLRVRDFNFRTLEQEMMLQIRDEWGTDRKIKSCNSITLDIFLFYSIKW